MTPEERQRVTEENGAEIEAAVSQDSAPELEEADPSIDGHIG